jgi:hypothetical protein
MKHPNIIHIDDVYLTDSKICMVREPVFSMCLYRKADVAVGWWMDSRLLSI